MLSVIILSSEFIVSVIVLSFGMLSVIKLSAIMLSVAYAEYRLAECH